MKGPMGPPAPTAPLTAVQAASQAGSAVSGQAPQMGPPRPQGLVAGPGQPPSTWADVLGLRALAEGDISAHDIAQAGLQKAAQGSNSLGEALALSAASFLNARGRKKANTKLGEAMAKERGLERYYKELDRIEGYKREDEISARKAQAAAAAAARARQEKLEDGQTAHERAIELQGLKNQKGPDTVYGDGRYERVGSDGLIFDQDTGKMFYAEGSPGAIAQAEGLEKDEAKKETARWSTDHVIDEIDYALGLNENEDTQGVWGAVQGLIAGSPRKDLDAAISTVLANVGFDRLQRMRDESKTGGALGQVSELELKLLQDTIAGYDPGQSAPAKARFLNKVKNHYTRFMMALDGQEEALYEPGSLRAKAMRAIEAGKDPELVMERLREEEAKLEGAQPDG